VTNRSRTRRDRRPVDGLLLLDKPTGMTSNGALQRVKRLFNARKAGHTGSLDPLASGLLPICLGQATKLSAFLLEAQKTYVVRAQMGTRTDTGDAEGAVIERDEAGVVTEDQLTAALADFRGEIQQVPPMYSALKQGGRRLYDLAREGVEVERAARSVTIYELDLLEFDPFAPVLRVRCSKGTYVRTLVEDISRACGSCAHVAALRRTAAGPFTERMLVSLAEIERASEAGLAELDRLLRPMDEAIADWPAVELGAHQAFYLRQGHAVAGAGGGLRGRVRLYGEGRRFLGIGEALDDGRIAPRRLLVNAGQGPV
jgi:tRNA pseudouridine55 synthase